MGQCRCCGRDAGIWRSVHPECRRQETRRAEKQAAMQALLRQGVEEWNRWREENPEERPNLEAAQLRHAKLSGAKLEGACFRQANLRGVDFSGSDLEGADFGKANLQRADLRGAYLERAHFLEADLSEARLEGARMPVTNFADAKLRRARLAGANMVGTVLRNANLEEADLRGAKIHGSDLRGADLRQARLEQAQLQQSDLSGVSLQEACLEGANLESSQFCGADLIACRLKGARLQKADFDGANLARSVLEESDCREARFFKSDLSGADLHAADLSGATIVSANLKGVRWGCCRVARIMTRDSQQTEIGDLIITSPRQAPIWVDSLQAAQLIDLIQAQDGSSALFQPQSTTLVLVVGRFADTRIEIGSRLRQSVRESGLQPVLIEWEKGALSRLLVQSAWGLIVDWTQAGEMATDIFQALDETGVGRMQPVAESAQSPIPQLSGNGVEELIVYRDAKDLGERLRESSFFSTKGRKASSPKS